MTNIIWLWQWLKSLGIVLWPIRFVLIIMLAMVAALSVPQAHDALYGAVIEGDGPWLVFVSVVVWAVQSWYWARFLLDLPLRGFPAPVFGEPAFGRTATLLTKTWAPRALGASVFLIVGIYVWGTSCADVCKNEPAGAALQWLALYVLCAVLFLAFTVIRRRIIGQTPTLPTLASIDRDLLRTASFAALAWLVLLAIVAITGVWALSAQSRSIMATLVISSIAAVSLFVTLVKLPLSKGTKIFVAAMVLANTSFFLASIVDAALFGRLLGPSVVLFLTAAIWVGGTSFFLALPGERLRLPVTAFVLLSAALSGWVAALIRGDAGDFDNHSVRAKVAASQEQHLDARMDLFEAFEKWAVQAPCLPGSNPCRKPMILVTAQGGASRSGYWVATVLGALEDAVPDFHKSVFAISSVSGGSLGAAVYQRLLARQAKLAAQGASAREPLCTSSGVPQKSLSACGQAVAEQDFLGPVFFSMFNADMLQRLLPGNTLPDRAEALEQAWERAWYNITGGKDFEEPFEIRTRGATGSWLPILFLNGASVKSGRRIMTSDVALSPNCKSADTLSLAPDLPSSLDFFCLTRQNISLSTAVHNSARFPFISPAGTLWASDGEAVWKADRIVDGGYVEAEGATTLNDLMGALQREWKINHPETTANWFDQLLPILIVIRNDPPSHETGCSGGQGDRVGCKAEQLSATLGEEAKTMEWWMRNANDLIAPIAGLASSRSGRGAYAARSLEVSFNAQQWPTYRFNLNESKGPAPAMSWYLSKRSRQEMARDLCVDGIAEQADASKADLCERRSEPEKSLCKLGQTIEPQLPPSAALLPDRIRAGLGCAELKKKIDPMYQRSSEPAAMTK